jgi:hypothetical protein
MQKLTHVCVNKGFTGVSRSPVFKFIFVEVEPSLFVFQSVFKEQAPAKFQADIPEEIAPQQLKKQPIGRLVTGDFSFKLF